MNEELTVFWTEKGLEKVPGFMKRDLKKMADPASDGDGWLRYAEGRHAILFEHIAAEGIALKFFRDEDPARPYVNRPPMSEALVLNGLGEDSRIPELYAWGNDFILMELVETAPVESLVFDFHEHEEFINSQVEAFVRDAVDRGFLPVDLNKDHVRYDRATGEVRLLDFDCYCRLFGKQSRRQKQKWTDAAMKEFKENMEVSFGWMKQDRG